MDYKEILISELEKDKDLYLSGEKKPIASYAFRETIDKVSWVEFYFNDFDNPLFTLGTEGDPYRYGKHILDELQRIAKQWRDEHKTMMS